jgi:hypothetical protein
MSDKCKKCGCENTTSAETPCSGNWRYSRNRARHDWWDEKNNCTWEVRAICPGHRRHIPQLDGYALFKVTDEAEQRIVDSFSVKNLKELAELKSRQNVPAEPSRNEDARKTNRPARRLWLRALVGYHM